VGTKQIRALAAATQDPAATVAARLSSDAATTQRVAEALGERFDPDALAVSAFEEPDGRWSLVLHFRDRPDEAAVRGQVAAVAGAAAADALVFETLPATDWVRKSLEGLKPVEAGRFTVHGAHVRAGVGANRIGIEIEAALAFGTGHHGSTRGCLLALDRLTKTRRHRRKTAGARFAIHPRRRAKQAAVLDVGTGTGVLAIAAAKALRRPVLASDIDARAVAIARDNARFNRAGASVEVIRAAGLGVALFRARARYDLIMANILLEPLKALATPIARLCSSGGYVVLSGLLTMQACPALASYRARGLVLARRIQLEGWTTLVLLRPTIARRRGATHI
jgi:ribosomal protein L11 methyltransferase